MAAQRQVAISVGGTSAFDGQGATARFRVDLTKAPAARSPQYGLLLGTWIAKADLVSAGGDRLLVAVGPSAFVRIRPGGGSVSLHADASIHALYSSVDRGGQLDAPLISLEEERAGTTWRALIAGEVGAGLWLTPTTQLQLGFAAGRHASGIAEHRAVYQVLLGLSVSR